MTIISKKQRLDKIIEEFKAQPVGSGYIDIIVSRDNYQAFAKALIEKEFVISAISWWEYLEHEDLPNVYGMGGPASRFYSGWFAESPADIDDIPPSNRTLAEVISIVENKVLGEYGGNVVTFRDTKSLTPAFWLSVDESWKSRQA